MPTTLQEFVSRSIWPYVIWYLLYILCKYFTLGIALVIFCTCSRARRTKVDSSHDENKSDRSPLEETEGQPQSKPEKIESFISQLSHRLVLHTFGRSSETLTAVPRSTNKNKDGQIIHFLGKTKMVNEHAMILVVHCISAITITIFIVIKMFLMNVITHACSTDMNIHCFPQILNENDSHLMPNISLQARTNDCSQWTHESFTDRITFLCFEFTYSIEGAIVALGGVLALFSPTMNVIIFTFHKLYELAKKCSCNKVLHWFQLIIGIVCILVEFLLVFLVTITGGIAMANTDEFFMNTVPERVAMFFISHGIVIIFIFGIVSTSFLLPWDMYVNSERKPKDK